MDFDYKNILIYGYSRSGKAVENVLKDIGVKYKIYDQKLKIDGGEFLSKLTYRRLKKFDLIVISPGVSIYNKYIKLAEKLKIKIISELEFGYWFTSADIIAITGTNGKTTTTTLVNKVLQLAGYKCDAYGNIGRPLSEAYKKDYDYIVCEVSSFQLEATDKFMAKIGVLLNISEDHIDRHKNYKNYINCKKSLFKNCNNNCYNIIDNNLLDNVINKHDIVGNVIEIDNSVIHIDKNIIYKNGEKIIEISERIINFTYLKNILAVLNIMDILNIPFGLINEIQLDDVNEHRMEKFLVDKEITYINDSKATNPDAVINGLSTLNNNVILMLGGKNKGINFNDLIAKIDNKVKNIIVFGDSANELSRGLKKHNKIYNKFDNLLNAINYVLSVVEAGDTVYFAPACASFDEFSGYEERGKFFKNTILSRLKSE